MKDARLGRYIWPWADMTCMLDVIRRDTPNLPREVMDEFVPRRTPSGRVLERVAADTFFDAVNLISTGQIVHLTIASYVEHVPRANVVTVPVHDLPPSETVLVGLAADNNSPVCRAFAGAARHLPDKVEEND